MFDRAPNHAMEEWMVNAGTIWTLSKIAGEGYHKSWRHHRILPYHMLFRRSFSAMPQFLFLSKYLNLNKYTNNHEIAMHSDRGNVQ